MEGLERIVSEHRLFQGLGPEFVNLAAGCAKNVRLNADQYLFHAEELADWIYLIRHGQGRLEAATPGRGAVQFETWAKATSADRLLPPYRWGYDARATALVRRSRSMKCLRDKCEVDHDLGYALLKRFLHAVQRLQAMRLQLLDVYGSAG
jgi:hypothetical protein